MDTNSHEFCLKIPQEMVLELARDAVRDEISRQREEILKRLQLVDEAGALAIFQIGGKDPRRTFRRLANKHKLEYVRIDGFKWWKLSAIEGLIDDHTVNKKKPDPNLSGSHESTNFFDGRKAA